MTDELLQQEDATIGILGEAEKKVASREKEKAIKAKKKDLDKKILELEANTLKYAEKYGPEDYRTQLMVQLLDVSYSMKEQNDMIQSVDTSMGFIVESMSLLDDSLSYQSDLMAESNAVKYGFFAKLKQKRMVKKTLLNIQNRMQVYSDRIVAVQKMGTVITESLRKGVESMQRKMAKNNAKAQKKKKQETSTFTSNTEKTRAQKFIEERMNGGNATQNPSAPTPPPTKKDGVDSCDDL